VGGWVVGWVGGLVGGWVGGRLTGWLAGWLDGSVGWWVFFFHTFQPSFMNGSVYQAGLPEDRLPREEEFLAEPGSVPLRSQFSQCSLSNVSNCPATCRWVASPYAALRAAKLKSTSSARTQPPSMHMEALPSCRLRSKSQQCKQRHRQP
jgi:hypothetical protein